MSQNLRPWFLALAAAAVGKLTGHKADTGHLTNPRRKRSGHYKVGRSNLDCCIGTSSRDPRLSSQSDLWLDIHRMRSGSTAKTTGR